MEKIINKLIRIILIACVCGLVISPLLPLMCEPSYAASEKAGDTLVVRVGYFGDKNDYRVKAKITNSQMKALPQQQNYYANMTRVGTIMCTLAEGPTLKSVLDKAGIDIGSVRLIHLRTTDSSGNTNSWFMEFPASKYIGSTLYSYPELVNNWDRIDDGIGLPLEGALKGGKKVDTILAVKSYATKSISEANKLSPSDMDTKNSYRLCAGQTPLKELVENTSYSSNESAKWIFGIDITLWGSPEDARGVALNLKDKNIKVGSTKKITATIKGQELFEDKVSQKLTWSSSNEEIATVDKQGNVTVKKEGKVTITAKAPNGVENSIVIKGTDANIAEDTEEPLPPGKPDGTGNADVSGTIVADASGNLIRLSNVEAIEVSLGGKVMEGLVEARVEMAEDAVILTQEEVDPKIMFYAGCTALLIFAAGAAIRTRRYYLDF